MTPPLGPLFDFLKDTDMTDATAEAAPRICPTCAQHWPEPPAPPEPPKPTLGGNIRIARKAKGWKISQLAAKCIELGGPNLSFSDSIISNLELGKGKRIGYDRLKLIAQALEMRLSDLDPEA